MTSTADAPVTAVTVDLDDTLYPQADWLAGAWRAVADAAGHRGLDAEALHGSLLRACAAGSDRGGIVDRALVDIGVAAEGVAELVPPLVAVFAAHHPRVLNPYPGVVRALWELTQVLPVVVVTDGIPPVQRAKVEALGLADLVAAVVVSDELGGRHLRKPDPTPFHRALDLLGRAPAGVVHVGDRPGKDVRGAAAAGMRCIRVSTGEYAGVPDGEDRPWRTVATFAEAAEVLRAVAPGAAGAAAGTAAAVSGL